MRILVFALIGLAVLVLAVLAYAATRPATFSVERQLRIEASPERLWPLVSELQGFNRWNPYARKDPQMRSHYSGPPTGVGSRYGWESSKVGTGSMTLTGQQPGRAVQLQLDFLKPFEAHNQAEFALEPAPGGGTTVHWRMHGPANLIGRVMGLFIDMDRMVGRDFEDGLQNLKQIAEART